MKLPKKLFGLFHKVLPLLYDAYQAQTENSIFNIYDAAYCTQVWSFFIIL